MAFTPEKNNGESAGRSSTSPARVASALSAPRQPRLVRPFASAPARPPAEVDDDEQRFARRRQTKTRAIIIQPNNEVQVDCVVRDISSTGALLHLPIEMTSVSRAGDYVCPRFTLRMPLERTEIDCEMAWRSGNKIGARFVSPIRMFQAAKRQFQTNKAQPAKTSGAAALVNRIFSK